MSYVVLARKWRPQNFDDLVGQGHVSRTLEGAIAQNRVAHAFLFTGVRGVGKTTSARILAKALNCEEGPTASPCLKCPACVEIGEGRDVDVQEIDGASYTGVDAVRQLQETVPYRPARDRYKIFIVDEVHMLSTAAWNAFLKTLEEPPPHVKFIFATTEVAKVPVTILSRCQRYDFKLIRSDEIAARLRHVLDVEGVAADDEAIRIVAREAAGSMRDAMSLLDQVIAWVGGSAEPLSAEGVARVLGVASRSVLHELGAAVVDGDSARCLEITASLAEQGYPLGNVARDFLEHLRHLVVAKVGKDPGRLLELADEELADVTALAERTTVDDLSRLYLGFSRAYDDVVRSAQVRGAFEMALVRLAHRPPLVPLDELLRRLAALEARLGPGGGPGGGGGGGARRGGPQRPAARPSGPGRGARGAEAATAAGDDATLSSASVEALRAAPPEAAVARASDIAANQQAASVPTPNQQAASHPAPDQQAARHAAVNAQTASPERRSVSPTAPSAARSAGTSPPPRRAWGEKEPVDFSQFVPTSSSRPPPSERAGSNGTRHAGSNGANPANGERATGFGASLTAAQGVGGRSEPPPSGPPPRPQAPDELAAWEAILARVRAKNAHFASIFEHAAPLSVGADGVLLGYAPGAFLADQADHPDGRALLARAASDHFGAETPVALDSAGRHREVQTLADRNAAVAAARLAAARKRVEDHPLVVAAREVLGAELREVRLP